MGARRTTRATTAALLASVTAAALVSGPSVAAQPSNSLEDQIAAAEAEFFAAQTRLARTLDAFTKAEHQFRTAEAAARAAASAATNSQAAAAAAAKREQTTRVRLDDFSKASYAQGASLTLGSAAAYLSSDNPADMLEKAVILDAISAEYTDVLATTKEAVEQTTAAERAARTALDQAVANRDAATKARSHADRAYRTAVHAQNTSKSEVDRLADRKAALVAQVEARTAATPVAGGAPATAPAAKASAPARGPANTGGSSAGPAAPSGGSTAGSSGGSGGGSAAPPAQPAKPAAPAPSGDVVLPARGTLTSTYGARWGTIHYGIDIANSIGTPIWSAMSGTVISSGPASGFGLWVRVQHDNGLITVYGHINESLVSVGQRVSAGQQIATIGNRGQSTGPHLHFEVHRNGTKIDPLPWLRSYGINP